MHGLRPVGLRLQQQRLMKGQAVANPRVLAFCRRWDGRSGQAGAGEDRESDPASADGCIAQLVEQLMTLDQRVAGSSPAALTNKINRLSG